MVAVLEFPLPSVAVIVIVFEPTSLQLNDVALNDTVGASVQLSVVVATTSPSAIVATPAAFKYVVTVPDLTVIDGSISSTITTS